MKNEYKYFNIPIPLLRELHIDPPSFFNKVFVVGVYSYSLGCEEEDTDTEKYAKALKSFCITTYKISEDIRLAKQILSFYTNTYSITGIEISMFFDFFKNYKSDFEFTCLAAFLAVKSILGSKPYCKTNKAHIHARMFGYNSVKELPKTLTVKQAKYKKRYPMDRVLNELQNNWNLKMLSYHNRGMYISFELSHDDLALIILKGKLGTKTAKIQEDKKQALERAKRIIAAH